MLRIDRHRRTARGALIIGAAACVGGALGGAAGAAAAAKTGADSGTSHAARRAAAKPAPAPTAHVTLTKVSLSGTSMMVAGRVITTNQGKRTLRVLVTLTSGKKSEKHTLTPKLTRFSLSTTTHLTGTITVRAQALVGGKATGTAATRSVAVTTTTTTPTTTTPTTTDPNAGAVTENLMGTFKIAPGQIPDLGAPTGSYMQVLNANGTPVVNVSAAGQDKNYTPLTPGTAGGLSTVAFQPPPNPAFSGNAASNDALASAIIAPAAFEGTNLAVVTAATDPQTGTTDPLPQITYFQGKLSGQVTAWTMQWNGQSINQGAPSPGVALPPAATLGSPPAPVTTPMTGTYDATTGTYTLDWQSPISTGTYAGDTGVWHLTGTFQGYTAPTTAPTSYAPTS